MARRHTVTEAAAQLGVTRQRVHQLIRTRGLAPRYQRVGGYRLVLLSARDVASLRSPSTRGRGQAKNKA